MLLAHHHHEHHFFASLLPCSHTSLYWNTLLGLHPGLESKRGHIRVPIRFSALSGSPLLYHPKTIPLYSWQTVDEKEWFPLQRTCKRRGFFGRYCYRQKDDQSNATRAKIDGKKLIIFYSLPLCTLWKLLLIVLERSSREQQLRARNSFGQEWSPPSFPEIFLG